MTLLLPTDSLFVGGDNLIPPLVHPRSPPAGRIV